MLKQLSITVLLVAVGCAHNIKDEFNVKSCVINRAAYDFNCPKEKINIGELQEKTFSASGCDKKGFYHCKYPETAWYNTPNLECAAVK